MEIRILRIFRFPKSWNRLEILIMILCFSTCLLIQSCKERFESFYPQLEDTANSGAIDRGWIPDFLPESSRDIHEMHDITSSRTWCAFEFSPEDAQYFKSVLSDQVENFPSGMSHIDSPKISWWPEFLEDDLDTERIKEYGFTLYVLMEPAHADKESPLIFAIDWSNGRGFFHRTYSQ